MEQEGYHQLAGNTGYLLLKVPQEILNEVKISVDEIQNDFTKAIPSNTKLAGQIDKEYGIKLSTKTTQYIKWTIDEYCKHNRNPVEHCKDLLGGKEPTLVEGVDMWVNFQEKYEYNPTHHHSGVFSYVIWYQIPFHKENELKYGAGKGIHPKANVNGEFVFVYSEGSKIKFEMLGIDKSMEGYMAIFPSNLSHQVYPFYTSDDYRITISGNIYMQGQ